MRFLIISLLSCYLTDAPVQTPVTPEKDRRAEHRKLLGDFFKDHADGGRLGWDHFSSRFMRLVDVRADDWVGYDSLGVIAMYSPTDRAEFSKAMDLLLLHHRDRSDIYLGRRLVSAKYFGTAAARVEKFLREVARTNPDVDVRAEYTFCLADFLKYQGETVRRLSEEGGEAFASRLERNYGAALVQALKKRDAGQLIREGEDVERRGRREFADYWKSNILAGRAAPQIEGKDLDGKLMTLSQFRGRVVVLSFWGFGCVPCRAQFPHEKALVKRLEGEPFVFLGVDNDGDLGQVRSLVVKEQIPWRSWWDGTDTGNPIARAWFIRSWPSLFVIDREGVVRYRSLYGEDLDLVVDSLLAEARLEQPNSIGRTTQPGPGGRKTPAKK